MEPTMEKIDSFIGKHEDSKCKSTNVTTSSMAVSLTVIREKATIRNSENFVTPTELDTMIRQSNPSHFLTTTGKSGKSKKKKKRTTKSAVEEELFIPSQDFDLDGLYHSDDYFIPIQYDCGDWTIPSHQPILSF